MADRPTTSTGKIKVNLALDPDAYELLQRRAPNRRAYGEYISKLLRIDGEFQSGEIKEQMAETNEQIAKFWEEMAELKRQTTEIREHLNLPPSPAAEEIDKLLTKYRPAAE